MGCLKYDSICMGTMICIQPRTCKGSKMSYLNAKAQQSKDLAQSTHLHTVVYSKLMLFGVKILQTLITCILDTKIKVPDKTGDMYSGQDICCSHMMSFEPVHDKT